MAFVMLAVAAVAWAFLWYDIGHGRGYLAGLDTGRAQERLERAIAGLVDEQEEP